MTTARRDRLLLVLLLLGQFALVSAQSEGRRDTLAEALLTRLLAPVALVATALGDGVDAVPRGMRTRAVLLEENQRLATELERARLFEARVTHLEGELARLATALDYRELTGNRIQVADVVYADYTSWLRTLIIRGGPGARFQAGQPVVVPEGLVGRIVAVAGPWAKVQLLTDRAAAVGVQLARTRRQAVLRGSSSGALRLEYLSRQAEVAIGDLVQTAGIDGVYPRGLIVGTVATIGPRGDLFHEVEVRPAVDLATLDQVLVLDRVELPTAFEQRSTEGEAP